MSSTKSSAVVPEPTGGRAAAHTAGAAALTLGALGVVFGDIGTSPLYALQTVFAADGHAIKPTPDDVYGVLSTIVWSITLIVSIKFVTFIMRADNDGEGGIMALVALIMRTRLKGRRSRFLLIAVGLFGVALFYGDGMITPAISVLSAVEGVKVVAPSLHAVVLPATLVVITGLFALQRYGTSLVGRIFGPVMAIWFTVLAVSGAAEISRDPAILKALSPTYVVSFFASHPGTAFIALGSIVLAVTGAEALYADMGHFGRPPIKRAWFWMVFPALVLNYLGQGALVLKDPTAIGNPFYLLIPDWGRIPMVALATLATLIASQAVISGAFSVSRQAVQLGFLPRLKIRHTSTEEIGQVYVPAVNWGLYVAVVALVIGFGSSAKLATAYGIAVTGTLAIDSLLFLVVARMLWGKPRWAIAAGVAGFLTVDLLFLAANATKIFHGGWLPLLIGVIVFAILGTWGQGRERIRVRRTAIEGPLEPYVVGLRTAYPKVLRLSGIGVYLNASHESTPLALRATVDHLAAIHKTVIVVSIDTTTTPFVADEERLTFDDLGLGDDGISHVTMRFGFLETPDVPRALTEAQHDFSERGAPFHPRQASYFLSDIIVTPGPSKGMWRWQKLLYVVLSRNAASPTEYFRLPPESTLSMAARVEL